MNKALTHTQIFKHLKLFLFLSFFIVFSIFYYFHTINQQSRIELELQNRLENLTVHYNLSLDYFYSDVKSIRSEITSDPKVLNIIKYAYNKTPQEQAVLRQELYEYLLPFYERIHSRGILQFQFQFPNNVTFLREHKPEKFGDDLSDIRYSYKYVNETKNTVHGFEQGKTVHAIRYVFPLFDTEKNHIGAAEISLSTKYLQDKLENSNKLHTHYIVNKEIFEVKAWKEPGMAEKYIQSVEHKDYMYTLTSHNFNKVLRQKEIQYLKGKEALIDKHIQTQKPFSIYVKLKDQAKVISFLPIKNIQHKKVVAYIVAHTDDYIIYNIIQDGNMIVPTVFIALVIIFALIYLTLNHQNRLEQEVEEKTKALQKINTDLEHRIQQEVDKNKQAQIRVFKSEKLASMGEMIGNIAHQWRQPLSVISSAATGILVQKEFGTLNDENIEETCNLINDNAQYLSQTINDFRNFIKGDSKPVDFNLQDDTNSFLKLMDATIKQNNIQVILDLQQDIKVKGFPNELIQCFINIFNNAKDALVANNLEDDRFVFISQKIHDDSIIISFKDNAGGIPKTIKDKIFEPYFTTKHQSQGTGLGLHMTYNLIVNHMKGSIEAENETYDLHGKSYTGAIVTIILPKN